MGDERLQKLEESISLYWSYTKSVSDQQYQETQELVRRLTDVEGAHKAVQQHLHDVEDAAPSGPRSIKEQLNDVREQVVQLRGRLHQEHEPRSSGSLAVAQHPTLNFDGVAERLFAVEERVDANCAVAASQIDKILQRVSEEWDHHRLELQEQRESVSALSAQVLLIDGRTEQCLSTCHP